METRRLRTLQQPGQIERLLEALVTRAGLVPEGAYQLRDRGGLPSTLQLVLAQPTNKGQVWTCWADSFRTWLFTAEMSLPMSRERRTPVLTVNVYGEDGELKECGNWMVNQEGRWQRCAD